MPGHWLKVKKCKQNVHARTLYESEDKQTIHAHCLEVKKNKQNVHAWPLSER